MRHLLLVLGPILSCSCFSQSDGSVIGGASDAAQRVFDQRIRPVNAPVTDSTMVEVMPGFPGGPEGLVAYLRREVVYPESALANGVEGTVQVSFIVRKDGRVDNVEVQRGADAELDKEAVRAVAAMPAWSPAVSKGEPVAVRLVLPVAFAIIQEQAPQRDSLH